MALLLGSCTQIFSKLNNPVDPKATSYQGYPTVTSVDKIRISSPVNGEAHSIGVITAVRVQGAMAYGLKISSTAATIDTNPLISKMDYSSNVMAFPMSMQDTSTYYVKVGARDKAGEWGWSPVTFFQWKTLLTMVQIQGGTFNFMQLVEISLTPFAISKTEVTQENYQAVMGINPSYIIPDHGYSQVPNRPVEYVTWFDAVEFCNRLSERENLESVYTIAGRSPASGYPILNADVVANWTKNGYRLPTEAEWEFAARGGISTHGYAYSGSDSIDDVAWYWLNLGGTTTHTVGTKAGNELGLFDMSGNVEEWCWDWNDGYPSLGQIDPTGPVTGSYRVLRGGSWQTYSDSCKSVSRHWYSPDWRHSSFGFRVARGAFVPNASDTTPPANPTVLAAVPANGQVTLSWTNPTDSDFASVEISWSPAGGSPSQPIALAAPAASQMITGLAGGTTYTFTVKAVDATGNKSSGTTVDGAPATPSASQLVLVPGGAFNNGAANVTVSSFFLDKYEVTQWLYAATTGASPSAFTGDTNRPVESITWYDAVEFCNALSASEGLQQVYTIADRAPSSGYPITYATVAMDRTKNGYRLPTEAEWTWAAKEGSPTNTYTYSGSDTIGDVAWYAYNSGGTPHPVGTKNPNALGLYDMTGNVGEWKWDWYDAYPTQDQQDPTGAAGGTYRLCQGGTYSFAPVSCEIVYRNTSVPSALYDGIGMRLARSGPSMTGQTGLNVSVTFDLGSSDQMTLTIPTAIAKGSTLNFSVAEVFGSYQWFLDPAVNTAPYSTGNSGSIDTSQLSPGIHELALFVLKSGVYSSASCRFTVTN